MKREKSPSEKRKMAWAAGTDAANRSAKAAGRDRWDKDDQEAINAYNKVMGEETS
jgi:hypothetical protein